MRGSHLFSGYLNDKAATYQSYYFSAPSSEQNTAIPSLATGWFCTGDIVKIDLEGDFHILGRQSIDILKSGGEKISALEIEQHYLSHESIQACAVLGVPHEKWGDEVVMAYVLAPKSKPISTEENKVFGKAALASYKIPKRFLEILDLPKNAMGKVQKKKLLSLFTSADS